MLYFESPMFSHQAYRSISTRTAFKPGSLAALVFGLLVIPNATKFETFNFGGEQNNLSSVGFAPGQPPSVQSIPKSSKASLIQFYQQQHHSFSLPAIPKCCIKYKRVPFSLYIYNQQCNTILFIILYLNFLINSPFRS